MNSTAASWQPSLTLSFFLLFLAGWPGGLSAAAAAQARRVLYNLDGDSCLTLKAGRKGPGPITTLDLTNLVAELTMPGSQVDTLLVCVNAQVMYYPTRVGTMRGAASTAEERAAWPPHERQRWENVEKFFAAGVDPYAVIFGEARRRGLETLLTCRMNDGHGNDFLRTTFWRDHPAGRLGGGALDFGQPAVREYVHRLIEETIQRYDVDGLELDFQRFPTFFAAGPADANQAAMNALVARVRRMLDDEGARRGRRLTLGVRAPSEYGQGRPKPGQALTPARSCDVAEWSRQGWIDFVVVSDWLFTSDTLDLQAWRRQLAGVPIYAGIQPETKPSTNNLRCAFCLGAEGYRRVARERWADGADGIYLFNFFTTREWPEPAEPPFSVLGEIGDPVTLSPSRAELVDVRRIWDGAAHNAFTDLLRHGDEWFCVFREGTGHIPGSNGVIRVLRSLGGTNWGSAAVVRAPGLDLRDPKISVHPDGRLMLLMGGSTYGGEERREERPFVRARTQVSFSADGRAWSAPQPVSVEGEWLWRVTWRGGVGYGFGYTFFVPARDVSLTLWKTTDGMAYERVARPSVPAGCWPDETTVRFLGDDTMVALVRGEQANHHAYVGTSRPPYTEWVWVDTGHAAQGPNVLVTERGRMLYGGRDFPAGARTVLGELGRGGAVPLLTLPSGGDTSYPGLVEHDGLVWMSYYASHEGKASIYLARIRVQPGDAHGPE